jgi:hypothetical protein
MTRRTSLGGYKGSRRSKRRVWDAIDSSFIDAVSYRGGTVTVTIDGQDYDYSGDLQDALDVVNKSGAAYNALLRPQDR